MLYAPTDPNYPHYSTYHVWFDGFGGRAWTSNSFRNALFGFHNPSSGNPADLGSSNRFENIWLAGVNVNTDNVDGEIHIGGGNFVFPPALALPSTPQFTAALANDVHDHLAETRGIFSNTILRCNSSSFTQLNDPYTTYAFSERTKQIGIKTLRLWWSQENTFNLLHTGIELIDVLLPGPSRPFSNSELRGNTFTSCRRGVEVHGDGLANRGPNNNPPPATVSLPLICNTFDRGNATRPGTAYGVYVASDARVTFDPLPAVALAPALTNKFLDYSTGFSDFHAIHNASRVARQDVRYTTYDDYMQPMAPAMLQGHSNLDELCDNITLYGNGNYTSGSACGIGSPGLERASKPGSRLESSSPNPASEHTTLHYRLAAEVKTAEVQIRRGIDGYLMHQSALRAGSTAHQVGLHGWPAGVYVVMLYADGVPAKSTKLIVQ